MNIIGKRNGVSFHGTTGITSSGFKRTVRTMPPEFRQEIKELHSFVKKKLSPETVVMMNLHNQNLRGTTTAKGAKDIRELILNMHIVGDNNFWGIWGPDLSYCIGAFKQHCANLGLLKPGISKDKLLTPLEKQAHDAIIAARR